MKRVAVHIVAGPDSGALLARLTAVRASWRAVSPHACPCCVGRVELQVRLARLLREVKPERILVQIPDPAHLGAVGKALGDWPLSQYVTRGRAIRLPEDAALTAEALESET